MKFASAFVLLASAITVCAAPVAVSETRAIANPDESFISTYYGRSMEGEGSVVENAIAERDVADPDNFFSRYYTKAFERVKSTFADDCVDDDDDENLNRLWLPHESSLILTTFSFSRDTYYEREFDYGDIQISLHDRGLHQIVNLANSTTNISFFSVQ
ncbi:hypothetical protein F5890DRAFT_1473355 [Lentinula detonsa]|uniref:Uncharacterized protein n=1 Tax=Lentinula detonsa TaxID=2804962 RepID=A0AA38Q237_9AGAR|nr:hypothetical protein F5890DRAFT_1473355 [Lentinula detonsa]